MSVKRPFERWLSFPIIDIYIKHKEETGDRALEMSAKKVAFSNQLYLEQFKQPVVLLSENTNFYFCEGEHVRRGRANG
jgi:hypothetical protein